MSRQRSGFTVIELLVGAVISALMLSAAFTFWRSGMTRTEAGLGILDVGDEMGRLLRSVKADCRVVQDVPAGAGAARIAPQQRALQFTSSGASSSMHETILTASTTRIIWRFQPGPKGLGTIERIEEDPAVVPMFTPTSREFGKGVTRSFQLNRVELDRADSAGGSGTSDVGIAFRAVLARDKDQPEKDIVVETIFWPENLSSSMWYSR